MIDTLIMMASLVVLGYALYISSRMLWVYKSGKDMWKWLYSLVSIFLIVTFFLFTLVTFSFLTLSLVSQYFNILNIVIGIFFLSGAGLIGAIMRYHLSLIGSVKEKSKNI